MRLVHRATSQPHREKGGPSVTGLDPRPRYLLVRPHLRYGRGICLPRKHTARPHHPAPPALRRPHPRRTAAARSSQLTPRLSPENQYAASLPGSGSQGKKPVPLSIAVGLLSAAGPGRGSLFVHAAEPRWVPGGFRVGFETAASRCGRALCRSGNHWGKRTLLMCDAHGSGAGSQEPPHQGQGAGQSPDDQTLASIPTAISLCTTRMFRGRAHAGPSHHCNTFF